MKRVIPFVAMLMVMLLNSNLTFAQFNESDIVITEISYNPPESGTDSLEYIELLNVGNTTIDMTDYSFTQGVTFTFPSYTLAPGAYVLVASDSVALFNNFGVTAFQYTGGLSNGGEDIVIYTAATGGTLVDSVDYDDGGAWPGSPDGDGPSLVLCDSVSDNSLASSWIAATTDAGFMVNGLTVYANPGAASNCPPACPDINAGITADTTFISCFGLSDGAIDLTLDSGAAPFTFIWSNGATTEDVSGLSSSFYSVSISDANGCQGSFGAYLSQPSELVAQVTVDSNASCNGTTDGGFSVVASGGTTAYSYLWSNGDTTATVTGVAAGMYIVTVTDANGCFTAGSATVTEPTAIVLSATTTDAGCSGSTNGAIDLTVSGGAGSYAYDWGGGTTTEDRTNLAAGSYTVTVTDGFGCSVSGTYSVSGSSAIGVTQSITDVACNGGSDGAIDITVSGGSTPYTYVWSTGATSEDINTLVVGTYTVTVTDDSSCTSVTTFNVTEPAALVLSANVMDVACNGGTDGSIDLTVTGGTTSYDYSWGDGVTSEDRTTLGSDTYDITVTDGNNCTVTDVYVVTEPSEIEITLDPTHVFCSLTNVGAVDATITGGTTPYSYIWSNGATTEDIAGLMPGTYTLSLTDAGGCTSTATTTVLGGTVLSLSADVTDGTCPDSTNGSIDLTVTGGSGSYTYLWSNGETTEDISGLVAGEFYVTVTDTNACFGIDTFTLTTVDTLCGTVGINNIDLNANDLMVYPNPATNQLNVSLLDNMELAKVELHSLSGALVLTTEPVSVSTTVDVSNLAEGMYILTVHTTSGQVGRTKVLISNQ